MFVKIIPNLLKVFYAAGECSCVSVHGANRLGANFGLEALLFGRFVGKTMTNEVDNIELRAVTKEDATVTINEINWIKIITEMKK